MILGVIKGDARSLDHSSFQSCIRREKSPFIDYCPCKEGASHVSWGAGKFYERSKRIPSETLNPKPLDPKAFRSVLGPLVLTATGASGYATDVAIFLFVMSAKTRGLRVYEEF